MTADAWAMKWGEQTPLTWTTENATEVSNDGLGGVDLKGLQSLTPNVATTYRLVAKGPGGTTQVSVPVTMELPEKVCISLHIEFDFDKSDVKQTTAAIEGHTDHVGTEECNEKLSFRRSEAVVAYLVNRYGIAAARLSSRGHGFSRPVADNGTAEGRQRNRRIDAVIDCVIK